MIEQVLNQRQATHGSFKSNAETSQTLKYIIQYGDSFEKLSKSQREALHMILHKISRIVNGNPNEKDHWVDICGYSQLIVDELNNYEKST